MADTTLDDLCSRVAAHPLLDRLTSAQVEAVLAVTTGSPDPAGHLPEIGDVWNDRAHGSKWTARVVEVQHAGRPGDWVVAYTPLTGADGQHVDPTSTTAGPWKESLRKFIGSKRYGWVDDCSTEGLS